MGCCCSLFCFGVDFYYHWVHHSSHWKGTCGWLKSISELILMGIRAWIGVLTRLFYFLQWLKKKHKRALYEALEKVKSGAPISRWSSSSVYCVHVWLELYYNESDEKFSGFVELMLLGFISLLLTVGQGLISTICISKSVAATWHPCSKSEEEKSTTTEESDTESDNRRKLLSISGFGGGSRRVLAAAGEDKCSAKVWPIILFASFFWHELK